MAFYEPTRLQMKKIALIIPILTLIMGFSLFNKQSKEEKQFDEDEEKEIFCMLHLQNESSPNSLQSGPDSKYSRRGLHVALFLGSVACCLTLPGK